MAKPSAPRTTTKAIGQAAPSTPGGKATGLATVMPVGGGVGAEVPDYSLGLWVDFGPPASLVEAYQREHPGPIAEILGALDHQLRTDSDLEDKVSAPGKYRALAQGLREAMAQALGYSGYHAREVKSGGSREAEAQAVLATDQAQADAEFVAMPRGKYRVRDLRTAFEAVEKGHWKDPQAGTVAGPQEADLLASAFEFFHGCNARIIHQGGTNFYTVSTPGYAG